MDMRCMATLMADPKDERIPTLKPDWTSNGGLA